MNHRLAQLVAAVLVWIGISAPVLSQDFPSPILQEIYEQTPLTAQCANRSFEKGFDDWTGFRAARLQGKPAQDYLNGLTPLLSTSCEKAPGIGDSGSGNSCHAIEQETVDISVVSTGYPTGVHDKKSIRLGGRSMISDNSDGGVVEGIAKRFVVTKANARYTFRYSSVMQLIHGEDLAKGDEPYFHAYAINPATGKVIAELFRPALVTTPGAVESKSLTEKTGGTVIHVPWTCAELDLRDHVGEEVIVYFVNADGSAGDSTAYTYLDDTCTGCGSVAEAGGQTPKPPAPTQSACLAPSIEVTCGYKPGTHVVTLTLKNADGSTPDSVELELLTPGVAFASGQKVYPVGKSGVIKVLLKGAKPGDLITFSINGSKTDPSSEQGLSTCCNSLIEIEIPAGMSCPKKAFVDLAILQEGGLDPALGTGNYLFNLEVINAGGKLASGSTIEVNNPLPVGMTLSGAIGVDWACSQQSGSSGGGITCQYTGSGPIWPGQILPSILLQAKAAGDGPFVNCATVGLSDNTPLEATPANNKACVAVNPLSALYLQMACGPATPDPSGTGLLATCQITVSTFGKQTSLLSINNGVLGIGSSGSLSSVSSPSWSCSGSSCKINGSELDQESSTSLFEVKVRLPNEGALKIAKHCALARNARHKDLDCATFSLADTPIRLIDPLKDKDKQKEKDKADEPDPPKPPKCDPRTAKLTGDECRCTIKGMVRISKTACACPDGTELQQGSCRVPPPPPPKCDGRTAKLFDGECRCVIRGAVKVSKTSCDCPAGQRVIDGRCKAPPPPAPKCDRATAVAQGGECVCRFKGMAQISSTACACTKGREFKPGVGCISPRPECEPGTRFSKRRGRCEPICGEGERYDVRRNRCVEDEPEGPFCDPATTVAKGGKCVCRFPGMRNRGNFCVCRRGQEFVRGEGCFGGNDGENDGGEERPKCRPPRFIDPETGRCVKLRLDVPLDLIIKRKRRRVPQDDDSSEELL